MLYSQSRKTHENIFYIFALTCGIVFFLWRICVLSSKNKRMREEITRRQAGLTMQENNLLATLAMKRQFQAVMPDYHAELEEIFSFNIETIHSSSSTSMAESDLFYSSSADFSVTSFNSDSFDNLYGMDLHSSNSMFSSSFDVNPASGFPMIEGCSIDVMGNPYGFNDN